MGIPLQIKAIGAFAVFGAVIFGFDRHDLSTNYTPANARITKASTDCYVEKRKSKLVDRETGELAYMDCDLAPIAAEMHGYSDHHIKRRTEVRFVYVSPVDGKRHEGEWTDRNAEVDEYRRGGTLPMHAHNEKADKYRVN